MKEMKVLIVEDEMIIALMIEQMVDRLGHTVVDKVVSGEEAVEAAKKYEPDVVLMDIRLQGEMDGIDAMESIRENENIQFIFITGNSDDRYTNRINEGDYLGLLTKPISYHELDRTINLAS